MNNSCQADHAEEPFLHDEVNMHVDQMKPSYYLTKISEQTTLAPNIAANTNGPPSLTTEPTENWQTKFQIIIWRRQQRKSPQIQV